MPMPLLSGNSKSRSKAYPFFYKTIIADLQNADVTTDVKVSTANALVSYAELAKVKFEGDNFVLKLYNIFGM